jgi:AraC family transcriptional regulator
MIANAFPDLQWLKGQINTRFQNRRGPGTLLLDSDGFPSVIINAKASNIYRDDVVGPISVFMNLQGESRCNVDGRTVQVKAGSFFISNRFQPYTLEIESNKLVETFNIHIGEHFSEDVLRGLIHSSDTLLNNGQQQTVPTVSFFNKLHDRTEQFNYIIRGLQQSRPGNAFNKLLFEEKLSDLLLYLLGEHRQITRKVHELPAAKTATKIELYKRLAIALDYMQTYYLQSIQLDELAAVACLSKFHFLRLFKATFRQSPHQYIMQLRLEKGKHLLKHSAIPVNEIASALGFENSNSFSRLLYQRTGVYPTEYRGKN